MTANYPYRIAYFVTPHGFGHAARACAVVEALSQQNRPIQVEILSLVPEWFFRTSLTTPFGYHPVLTDIGLAQKTALAIDLPETVRRLDQFLPFTGSNFDQIVEQVQQLNCQLIICDIAPMGIAVAKTLEIPSLLIENFTWDWIYEPYFAQDSRMAEFSRYLGGLVQQVDYHIQTKPVCETHRADLTTAPISRPVRASAAQTRQSLEIPAQAKVVLVTMGGMQWQYTDLAQLEAQADIFFIIPGASDKVERHGQLILLPHHSTYFHPDLINAADVVIGKLGYSTLAEVYQAGIPFGYIDRPNFREAQPLTAFIKREMQGCHISPDQFEKGEWLKVIPNLLALPRMERLDQTGATAAANFIYQILEKD